MLGALDILVFFEHVSVYVQTYWDTVKESLRNYLGPSPNTTYLVFDNEDVIPAGKEHCKYAHVAHFSPAENKLIAPDSHNPYKRLPWISIQHVIGDHVVDLSDWLSNIRSNTQISLLAILRLASHVLNMHLPETSHAKILVITRTGEEEEYTFVGNVRMVKYSPDSCSIARRQTCPFDAPLFF